MLAKFVSNSNPQELYISAIKKQIFECLVAFETFAYNYMIIIEYVICMQLYLPPFSLAL